MIELAEPDAIEASTGMELTVQDRACVALASTKTRADLAALVKKSVDIKDIKNAAGRDECHGAAMALTRARTSITKAGKAAREDAQAFQKAVIAEEKSLIEITEAEEARLLGLRDVWDKRIADEKAETLRIEAARKARLQEAVDAIRNSVGECIGKPVEAIDAMIVVIEGVRPTEAQYQEYLVAAVEAREEALPRLQKLAAGARDAEVAKAKAEQDRIEAARVSAIKAKMKVVSDLVTIAAMARTSALVQPLIVRAEQTVVDESYQEFQGPATTERANVIQALRELHSVKFALEQKAAQEAQEAQEASTAAPEPLNVSPIAPAKLKLAAVPTKPQRPSDDVIVQALAEFFRVHESKIVEWLLDMDLPAYSERMVAAEFR